MNILFLDDQEARHRTITELLEGQDIQHCYTSEEAIEAIKKKMPDIIMLDHDLNGTPFQASTEEGTGYDVACFLEEYLMTEKTLPKRIVLHTMNGPGGLNMLRALRNYPEVYFIPFSLLTHKDMILNNI